MIRTKRPKFRLCECLKPSKILIFTWKRICKSFSCIIICDNICLAPIDGTCISSQRSIWANSRGLLATIPFFVLNGRRVHLPLIEILMSLILQSLSKLAWPNLLCYCKAFFPKSSAAIFVEWWCVFTSNLYNPCSFFASKRSMSPLNKPLYQLYLVHAIDYEWFLL